MNKPIFILGPTASGKSKLGLEIAKQLKNSALLKPLIFNCDSIQIYKHLDIGSAKPTHAEMESFPHFLFNQIDYPHTWTAQDYARAVKELFNQLKPDQRPLLVGGSGFYLQPLLFPTTNIPAANPDIKKDLEDFAKQKGISKLYIELIQADPECTKRIHANDAYRIIRALTFIRQTGCRWSDALNEAKRININPTFSDATFIILKTNLDRLTNRIQKRLEEQILQGWQQEVENLIAQGMGGWAPMQSVGYKQWVEWLNAKPSAQSYNALKEEICLRTRQLAKRQQTWFQGLYQKLLPLLPKSQLIMLDLQQDLNTSAERMALKVLELSTLSNE